jgi:hypothetical protein
MRKLCFALLALSACSNQTSIQRDYVSERDECQGVAEERMDAFMHNAQAQPMDERGMNAKLVRLFSDCMVDYGWSVATPEREEDLAGGGGLEAPGTNLPAAAGQAPGMAVYYPQNPGAAQVPVYYANGRRVPYQNPYAQTQAAPQNYYMQQPVMQPQPYAMPQQPPYAVAQPQQAITQTGQTMLQPQAVPQRYAMPPQQLQQSYTPGSYSGVQLPPPPLPGQRVQSELDQ